MYILRRMLNSKVGGIVALVFVVLVGLAFAAGDMTSQGSLSFGGSKSDTVATIGKQALSADELQARAQMVFERVRQQQPDMTMAQFLDQGGLTQIADQLIANKALMLYGAQHGMRISKALIDAEIASNPAFADATGNFSQTQFEQMLQQQKIPEKALRTDIAAQLMQQQLISPAGAGTQTPEAMVEPYAGMLMEQRTGEMVAVPSAAFAPKTPPSDAELQAFYKAHPTDFIVPEQRKLRYAVVDRSRFEAEGKPTEAEIANAYKLRADEFKERHVRDFSQLILPDEAMAKTAAAQAKSGTSLADVASKLGLAVTPLKDLDEAALADQTSDAIAKSAFAAKQGELIGPVKAPLGWTVLRVEAVRTIAGKTLEQAKAQIVPELAATKLKQVFSAFLNDLDGKLGDGANLDDLAKADNFQIVETPAITATGTSLDDPDYKADPVVEALLKKGFSMSADDDPQIVSVKPEEEAAILKVGAVVPAGPPPFAKAKSAVAIAWGLSKGAAKADEVAKKINAALNKGDSIDQALSAADFPHAPRQPISARRAQINQQNAKIPPPMAALFTMKANTARLLPLERNQGFVIIKLDKITQDSPKGNQGLLASTRQGLAGVLGDEYGREMIGAIERKLNVKRSPAAMAKVEAALRKLDGTAQ